MQFNVRADLCASRDSHHASISIRSACASDNSFASSNADNLTGRIYGCNGSIRRIPCNRRSAGNRVIDSRSQRFVSTNGNACAGLVQGDCGRVTLCRLVSPFLTACRNDMRLHSLNRILFQTAVSKFDRLARPEERLCKVRCLILKPDALASSLCGF